MSVQPIAVVGMAGRFPGADGLDTFWDNTLNGRNCIGELTDDELRRHGEHPDRLARQDYVRKRPTLTDTEGFDTELFGMTPREAELRDPQYRLMLETVHATLEHAGYDPQRHPGEIGLFAATNTNRYRHDYVEHDAELMAAVGHSAVDIANDPDYMSTFISYKLGLHGISATVLTACSSSLVAVHLACSALRAGDCAMAVAGGVDVEFPYHRGYLPVTGGILSHDGVVRSFSADATGTNFGDGVGAVLLKPLDAARRDGDLVHAVVLGSAVNNDGARKVGYSAPSVAGQSDCIRRALERSGVDPAEISYVEAHGTGTRVGDPIEVAGLTEAFHAAGRGPLPAGSCGIGSVKSNIGHLGQAAGVAALIKTILAMTHERLPPTINVSVPNPGIDWSTSPFRLVTEPRDWPAVPGRPRWAGVSSFGMGGTNAHLVLEEAPRADRPRPRRRPVEVLTWSAASPEAELALRGRLADHVATLSDDAMADAAHTLRIGRTRHRVRAAVVAADAAQAAQRLRTGTRVRTGDGVRRQIVFAFPGQGAQLPGMYHDLYADDELFRSGCDAAFDVLAPLLGRDLRALWLDPETTAADLAETAVAQPLLYVVEYTLAHCLMAWGVRPDLLVGHSVGELAAYAVAEGVGFEDGLTMIARRAAAIEHMPRGRMLAVAAGLAAVEPHLPADGDTGVVVGAVNGPQEVVLSGTEDALARVVARLDAAGVVNRLLPTSHAFHSPAMAAAAGEFEAALTSIPLGAPEIPVVSAATGAELSASEAASPRFWARQLVEPVRFAAAADRVTDRGPAHVVEVGPGRTLTSLVRTSRPDGLADSRFLPTGGHGADGDATALAESLAQLLVDGVGVTAWDADGDRGYRRAVVPGYPYQRRPYWVLPPDRPEPGIMKADPLVSHPTPALPADPAPAQAPTAAQAPTPEPEPAQALEPEPTAPPERRWYGARTSWHPRALTPGPVPVGRRRGRALLLAAPDPDAPGAVATDTARGALQRAGYLVRVVPAPGPDDTIDPARWLADLDRAGAAGGDVLLAHAALPPASPGRDPAERLTESVLALLAVLRATGAVQRRLHAPVRLAVLGSGLFDVTGGERVDPPSAAVAGLLLSAEQELGGVTCRLVDVGDRPGEHALGAALAAHDRLVAVRGTRHWLPRVDPDVGPHVGPDVANAAPVTGLREHGTYLITGGLGGIGLVLARALAGTGTRPTLVLLGRTDVTRHPARDAVEAELRDLTDLGARVLTYACDVADAAALAGVVDAVEADSGPVTGVVHSAGIIGGGLLEQRTAEQTRAVLVPKVAGTLALEAVFADRRPLDFLVLCSSVAAFRGLYGSTDYAAANAFLDAHATACSEGQRRTVSVQWPGWSGVGMLARSPEGRTLLLGSAGEATGEATGRDEDVVVDEVIEPGHDWRWDEHTFDGVPVFPATAMLEFLLVAARARSDTWPVELRDVVIPVAMVGDGPRRLQVVIGHAGPAGASRRMTVRSRPRTGGAWTDHATATWVPADPGSDTGSDTGPGVGPGSGPATDIVARHRALAPRAQAAAHPPPTQGRFTFGPRWHAPTDVRGGDGELIGRLVLPQRYHDDLDVHILHPALMDVAPALALDLMAADETHVPFLYRRVSIHGPVSGDLWLAARLHPTTDSDTCEVDLDFVDAASGRMLVHVDSYVMRAVDPTTFTMAPAPAPTPEPTPAAPPVAPIITEGAILTPEEGAEFFLGLLQSTSAPVVLVEMAGSTARPPGLDDLPENLPADPPAPTATAAPPPPPAPSAPTPAPAASGVPATPARDVATELAQLWSSAIGITDIAHDADFFDIGGNSLAAVQLVGRINAHFDVELGVGTLLDHPTIDALAREVSAMRR